MTNKLSKIDVVEVLPPAESLPTVQVDHTPAAVLSQYQRAIGGTLEIIRFGAMLIEIDMSLTRETHKGGCFQTGDSLKSWMEDNCPEINYKTAIRYKTLAQGLQDMFKIPAKLPLTLALPSADGSPKVYVPDNVNVSVERVEKIQLQVWELVNGKSARQLQFDFGLTNPKPKGGARNLPKNLTAEESYKLQCDAADQVWARFGDDMVDQVRRIKSHLMLSSGRLDQVLVQLEAVRDALKIAKTQS